MQEENQLEREYHHGFLWENNTAEQEAESINFHIVLYLIWGFLSLIMSIIFFIILLYALVARPKKVREEPKEEEVEIKTQITVRKSSPEIKDLKDKLNIDTATAKALFNSDYRTIKDLEGAIIDDLTVIDGINPTTARKVIENYSKYKEL